MAYLAVLRAISGSGSEITPGRALGSYEMLGTEYKAGTLRAALSLRPSNNTLFTGDSGSCKIVSEIHNMI